LEALNKLLLEISGIQSVMQKTMLSQKQLVELNSKAEELETDKFEVVD